MTIVTTPPSTSVTKLTAGRGSRGDNVTKTAKKTPQKQQEKDRGGKKP